MYKNQTSQHSSLKQTKHFCFTKFYKGFFTRLQKKEQENTDSCRFDCLQFSVLSVELWRQTVFNDSHISLSVSEHETVPAANGQVSLFTGELFGFHTPV